MVRIDKDRGTNISTFFGWDRFYVGFQCFSCKIRATFAKRCKRLRKSGNGRSGICSERSPTLRRWNHEISKFQRFLFDDRIEFQDVDRALVVISKKKLEAYFFWELFFFRFGHLFWILFPCFFAVLLLSFYFSVFLRFCSSLLLCFSTFVFLCFFASSLLSLPVVLPLRFSAFPCFSAFPASLLLCFLLFPASLLTCFSASLKPNLNRP